MTTEQFILRVKKWEGYLKTDFQKDVLLEGAKSLVSKIANRVQETGVTGTGKQHQYSTKPILVGAKSFENKSGFTRAMAMAKKPGKAVGKKGSSLALQTAGQDGTHWVTITRDGVNYHLILLQGGYKMVRMLEGKPTFAKIYSRTTEMWRGFGIKSTSLNKVEIGGRTTASQNKINWNSERDKDNIIAANQVEIDQLGEYVAAGIAKFISTSFA